MPQGTSAILTGKPLTATGGVMRAPIGTALPTDAMSKLDAAFKKLGYVDEDGVTRTVDASDDKIKAWGGVVVAVVRSDYSVTYTMKFMESANATLLKAIFGEENVKVTAPVTGEHAGKVAIIQNSQMVPKATYTLEMLDQNTFIREVIPNGQLTVSDDVQFVHSGVITYSITIEAMLDEYDNNSYEYQDTAEEGKVNEVKNVLLGDRADGETTEPVEEDDEPVDTGE